MRKYQIGFFIFIIITFLLSSCNSISNKPTITEQKIASVAIKIIVQQIHGTADYIENSGQPWVEDAPDSNLIVWYKQENTEDVEPFHYISRSDPIKAWYFSEGNLSEAVDTKDAIEKFDEDIKQYSETDIWAYGYYAFAIESISKGNREAVLNIATSCGPLCGNGTLYTLRKDWLGRWQVINSEMLYMA